MTAPSNPNTSGLENAGHIVWWKAGGVNYFPEGESFGVSKSCRVEPLVTAASAQARIAELEADVAEAEALAFTTWPENGVSVTWHEMFEAMQSRFHAAEARADRLAQQVLSLGGTPMA